MTKKNTTKGIILFLSLILLFSITPVINAVGENAQMIAQPSKPSVGFGEEFTVDILINAENVLMVQCYIQFDATLLEAVNVTNGEMFSSLWSNGSIDNINGRIDNIWSFNSTPVSGGVFATVTFKAKNAVGDAFINFNTEGCIVVDPEGQPYPLEFTNATVEVKNPPVNISIEPTYEITKDSATLNIYFDPNGNEVIAVGFDLFFNPEYFNVTDVENGGLFNTFSASVDNDNGKVTIIATQIPFPPGVKTPGLLASVKFEAKATGVSDISIKNVDIRDINNTRLYFTTQNATLEADVTPPEVYITSLYPSYQIDGLTYSSIPLAINATVIEDNLREVMLFIIDNETGKFLYVVNYQVDDVYSLEWNNLYNLTNGTLQDNITVWRTFMDGTTYLLSFGYFNQTGGTPDIPVLAFFHENLTLMMIAIMNVGPANFTYGVSTYLPINVFAQQYGPPIFVNSSTIFVITEDFKLIPVPPEEKEYMIMFRAIDAVENENESGILVSLDNTPPVTTKEVGEPKYGNYILPTTPIYINASDGGAGFKEIHYRIDDGSEQINPNPNIMLTLETGGDHTIEYWAVDNLGNEEEHHIQSHFVDNSAPSTTLLFGTPYYFDGTYHWISSSTQITLNANDIGSGINKTYYYINTPPEIEYTTPFTISEEGTYIIYYYSIDNLGNIEETKSMIVKVDNTSPNTTLGFSLPYYYDGTKEWITSSTSISLSATDSGAGLNKTFYYIDNLPAIEYTAPFTISSGMHTIYYYSIDKLGNIETAKSTVVYVDNMAPITNYSLIGTLGDAGWYKSNVIVNLTSSDDGSGVNKTYYKIGAGNWSEYTTPFTISEEGQTTIYYYSIDKLGNVEANKSITIKIDKTAPTAIHSIVGTLVEGKYTTDVTISFTASDATSGVKEIRYKVDGTNYVISGSPGSHTVSSEGTHTVEYYAVDNAGNACSTATFSFTIQKNKPPVANFTYSPLQPYDTDTITFADRSTDEDGSIVNRTWDFGDGSVAYTQNPTHKYADNGTYVVKLIVKDDKGANASTSQIIEVRNKPPTALITYSPDKPKPKEDINFTSLSTDEDGSIVNYTWQFGDGNISYEQNPRHAYEKEGTYNVTLIVKDNDGATAEKVIQIEIKAEKVNIWLYLIIIVILIIIAIAVFAIWKRRSKGEEKKTEEKKEKPKK
jgi:PKD repeat protein